jgi:glycerol-3-phosphate cytidylyltransferase
MRIYSGGTYDLFHYGHVRLLKRLKQMAGENGTLIVAVNTDEFIEQFKGSKPVMSLEERIEVLEACKYVDEVVVNHSGADSKPTILKARADFVVVGTDWSDRDYMSQMGFTREWLEDNNIGYGFLPYTTTVSTTDIKKRLNKQ